MPALGTSTAFVSRHAVDGVHQWGQFLSSNANSVAIANAVIQLNTSVMVAGTFAGEVRIFGPHVRTAMGQRDMFIVRLDLETGTIGDMATLGNVGVTVEVADMKGLNGDLVISGTASDGELQTPSGLVDCPDGADNCGFIVRIDTPTP